MNSLASDAGKEGCVTSAKGAAAIRLTAEKSFSGS